MGLAKRGACTAFLSFTTDHLSELPRMKLQSHLVALSVFLSLVVGDLHAHPVVPGFERTKDAKSFGLEARGEILLGELNCLSCHSAGEKVTERIQTKSAPDLSEVGRRLTPHYIQDFIRDPQSTKHGTTMPGIFHSSEAFAADGAAEFLTHFLVSKGGPIAPSEKAISRSLVNRGKELFHSIGCVACHQPDNERAPAYDSVPLGPQARKTTVEQLSLFLQKPHQIRSSGRMPDLGLSEAEAEAIAYYLLKDQVENPPSGRQVEVAGYAVEHFEGNWSRLPDFSKLKPVATAISEKVTANPAELDLPKDGYALRFTGVLSLKRDAEIKFWLRSDDGSRLLVDGKTVINNDGVHPANEKRHDLKLAAGDHEIVVEYFEKAGFEALGLRVAGPGLPRGELDSRSVRVKDLTPMAPLGAKLFKVDPQKAIMGERMFAVMRCVSCHKMDGLSPMQAAPSLAAIRVDSADGCLSDNIRKGLPDYQLSGEQRDALKAALAKRAGFASELSAKASVERTLATLNCYACHQRDGLGGPSEDRKTYFGTNVEIDLGDEGRLPPHLNDVGSKLNRKALERILLKRQLHVRPFMATRMPQFGDASLKGLVDHLVKADLRDGDLKKPAFSEESVEVGHQFVGVKGLSCIACHNVNGNKAVGVQGIDLVYAHERLNPGWFHRFLYNPATMNPGTRMPAFWPEGKSFFPNILGGDTQKQFSAIWNYLSLGESMKAPEGILLRDGIGEELIPVPDPIVHRTFMDGVGPRTIVAGFPEMVHVAFDANQVRMAKVWRGRFFDASGVSSGRTGSFLEPLGSSVIDLPDGPAVARLESSNTPWPVGGKGDRNLGGSFRGYRLDPSGRPTFRYEVEGIEIEEQPVPKLKEGGACMSRHFVVSGKAQSNVYLLAARGRKITQSGALWVVDDRYKVSFSGEGLDDPFVRQSGENSELLIPVQMNGDKNEFEILVEW